MRQLDLTSWSHTLRRLVAAVPHYRSNRMLCCAALSSRSRTPCHGCMLPWPNLFAALCFSMPARGSTVFMSTLNCNTCSKRRLSNIESTYMKQCSYHLMSLLSLLLLRLPCLPFRHRGQSQLFLRLAAYTNTEPEPLLDISSTALMSTARTCQSCAL